MNFKADAEIIIQALSDFYEQSISGEGPVIHQPPMSALIADMELSSLVRNGGLSGEKLAQFVDQYLSAITRIYHPANIAHQQAVPHYMAALAGMVNNFVSSDDSIYEIGPASVSIQYFLINWLLDKVGWKPSPLNPQYPAKELFGGGILTHGGSIANLTALIAARTKIVKYGQKGIRAIWRCSCQLGRIIRLRARLESWAWGTTLSIHLRLTRGVSLSLIGYQLHMSGSRQTANKY